MKKIIVVIFALLTPVTQLIADNYRIVSMNVPSVIIGGKKCFVGSVFSDNDVISWTIANEELWVVNTDSRKKLLISKSLFESKKIKSVKDFYIKINTPGTMSGNNPEWTLIRAQKSFGEKRKALVIGNSNYLIESTLRAPGSDAIKIANKLSALGFDVYLMIDSRKSDMDLATRAFSDMANGAEIVMFYYIGHGQQIAGETYLLPIESTIGRESDRYSCMYGPHIVARINETDANTKLIFLDACRSEGNYQMGAPQQFSMEAPVNGMVMFSTKQGDYAFDGETDDSTPFTKAFCKNIDNQNTRLELVLSDIIHDVTKLTSGYLEKQIPNYNNSLTHEVVLNRVSVSTQQNNENINATLENGTDIEQLWIRKAEQGDAIAQFKLGEFYLHGDGVPQSCKEAARWFRKSAEQGLPGAQNYLGNLYYTGFGVSQDYTEALQWYHKAAEQGDVRAQCKLAYMYHIGLGVTENFAEAEKWYRKAADQNYTEAQVELGNIYRRTKDYTEALKWYLKAAEHNHPTALHMLGYMYDWGLGVPKNETEASKWYLKAAEQGDEESQYNLGEIYHFGRGVPKDETEALKWYRKAAEQGNHLAKLILKDLFY